MSAATVRRLGDARAALGALVEGAHALPDPELLIRPFQKREAVLSSRIEGTRTTLDESLFGEATDAKVDDDAREVGNYERALQLGLTEIQKGRPLSIFVVRDLHRVLLSGVRGESKRPGEFRDQQVWIGTAGRGIDAATFVPPPPSQVQGCLDSLETYLRDEAEDDALVRAAITHWHFETVHPFLDGNGRVGRLLVVLQLIAERVMGPEAGASSRPATIRRTEGPSQESGRGLPGRRASDDAQPPVVASAAMGQPWLYVSPAIERRRDEYYAALNRARRTGDMDVWLEYFVDVVTTSARETLDRLRRVRVLDAEFRARLRTVRTPHPLQLIPMLFANPYLTVATARRHLGVSTARSAQLAITHLIEAGILEPVENKRRGARGRPAAVYRCRELAELLRE